MGLQEKIKIGTIFFAPVICDYNKNLKILFCFVIIWRQKKPANHSKISQKDTGVPLARFGAIFFECVGNVNWIESDVVLTYKNIYKINLYENIKNARTYNCGSNDFFKGAENGEKNADSL